MLGTSGAKGSTGKGKQSEINGCQYQEAVWIEVQVDMPFKIGGGHGRGLHQEFVYDADGPAFLKTELMRFGVDGYR